jgi:HAD superfamily hydrolase (TIGR01509 family)
MPSCKIHGVVFDMDGVVIDSHPGHRRAWKQFLQSAGRDATETELDVILDGHKREDILHYFFGDLAPEKITEYGARKDQMLRELDEELRPIAGVVEFLVSLRQAGARIGLATSASRKRVHATIAELGLTHYFDVIVTGDEVACGKPDPSIYRLAAEYLQEAPQNLVAIEDALAGVQAATTAGIRCIGLAFGAKAEILRSAGADPVVSHFQQLSLPTLQEHFSIERHSMAASEEPGHGRSQ